MRWMPLFVVLVGCEMVDDAGCPDAEVPEVADAGAESEESSVSSCAAALCAERCFAMNDKNIGGACAAAAGSSCECCSCLLIERTTGVTFAYDGFLECSACGMTMVVP